MNRRIWKAGAMAVVATVAFAIFAFRIEEWSKGFDAEFLVYGQTGGGGTGGSTGGTGVTGGATFSRIIPHIPVGSFDTNVTKYGTVIQVLNLGNSAVNVSGEFYNTDGTNSTLQMRRSDAAGDAAFTQTFSGVSVESNGVLVITADTSAGYTANWGRITASGTVTILSYFELRFGGTNVLINRVGISASPEDRGAFVIPRVANQAAGLDMGFALLNTGTTSANITVTLRGARGNQMGARTITLGARSQIAIFARDFFTGTGCSPCLGTEPTGTGYGTMVFRSTSRQFAAAALAIEGGSLSSFPIDGID